MWKESKMMTEVWDSYLNVGVTPQVRSRMLSSFHISLSLASLLDVAPSCWAWLTLNFLSTRLNIIILSKSFPAEMQSRVNRRTRCSLTKSWTKISKTNYRGSCLPSRCLPGASYCSPVTFLLLGDCFIDWLLEIGTWNPVVLFFF